jgi:hypothetical protein
MNIQLKILELLSLHIDLTEIIHSISELDYVITKFDVPYMPVNFPINYPYGKDIDILCTQSDYNKLVSTILDNTYKYQHNPYNTKLHIIEEGEYGIRIRLEKWRHLIIQFDISGCIENTENNFIHELIRNRQQKDFFYIPSLEFEYLIRIIEVFQNPDKKHHVEYLKNHINSLNPELCDVYLDFDWRKYVPKILTR